jgi:uncharacterized membrane protein YoaK (UPF0700 family)
MVRRVHNRPADVSAPAKPAKGLGPPSRTVELFLLTWTSGTLDGLSYLAGRVFTANMTGNTVLLGLHLVQGEFEPALRSAVALGAWVCGCVAGALLFAGGSSGRQANRNLVWAARVEFPLLALFAWLFIGGAESGAHTLAFSTIAVAAFALGIQSVAVRRLRIRGVATTFITGTITTATAELTSALRKRRRTGRWPKNTARAVDLAVFFLIYLGAAFSAGSLAFRHPVAAAILPLSGTGILACVGFRFGGRSH